MTIKQQGGIFGRKPSFNTVETSASGNSIIAERTGSDGHIVTLKKDGTDVGYLQSRAGVISELILDPRSAGGAGLAGSGEAITPMDHSQQANNHTSLGNATYKWKNLYLSGNVIVDNGKGIDFSATSGTGTSELFDDYEEGTWTPSIGGTATYTSQTGTYTKTGRLVTVQGDITINSIGSGSIYTISGLPFTAAAAQRGSVGNFTGLNTGNIVFISCYVDSGTTSLSFNGLSAAGVTSGLLAPFKNGAQISFAISYYV